MVRDGHLTHEQCLGSDSQGARGSEMPATRNQEPKPESGYAKRWNWNQRSRLESGYARTRVRTARNQSQEPKTESRCARIRSQSQGQDVPEVKSQNWRSDKRNKEAHKDQGQVPQVFAQTEYCRLDLASKS